MNTKAGSYSSQQTIISGPNLDIDPASQTSHLITTPEALYEHYTFSGRIRAKCFSQIQPTIPLGSSWFLANHNSPLSPMTSKISPGTYRRYGRPPSVCELSMLNSKRDAARNMTGRSFDSSVSESGVLMSIGESDIGSAETKGLVALGSKRSGVRRSRLAAVCSSNIRSKLNRGGPGRVASIPPEAVGGRVLAADRLPCAIPV